MKSNGVSLAALGLSLICVATIFCLESVSQQSLVLTVWVLGIGALYQKFGILHPLLWFPPFFLAYSISYPLFVTYYGYSDDLLLKLIPISAVALLGFLAGTCFVCKRASIGNRSIVPKKRLEERFHMPLLLWCLGVLAIVFMSGATSKREVLSYVETNSLISLALNAFPFLIIITLSVILWSVPSTGYVSLVKNRTVALTILVLFLAFGVLGERDLIFRFLLCCFLIVQSRKNSIRSVHVVAVVMAAFFILPITQAAKSFFLNGDINATGIAMEELLGSEFASASRNLHYILGTQFKELNGVTYIWDVQRFFSFLFPDAQSTTSWFNNVVRGQYAEGGTSGWGFSLVAEAYVNFGLSGVFFQFLFIGLISIKVYTQCRRGVYRGLFYLLYIPTLIYCLRADMANYLSLNLKQNMLLIICLVIAAAIHRSWFGQHPNRIVEQK